MYDANNAIPDFMKTENQRLLYGFEGVATSLNDRPAIIWLDENLEFVKGEVRKCCANCEYVGRSAGAFFSECLCQGFQINDDISHSCDNFKLKIS